METALQRVADYNQSSAWSKYDGYLSAVCDDGFEDDIATDGDCCYELHKFRRCAVIVWRTSQGFHHATEYDHAEVDESWRAIVDAIGVERENAAQEAYPDRWIVRTPSAFPYAFESCNYNESDARDELALVLRQVRLMQRRGAKVDMWRTGDAFEVRDTDDATMTSPLVGLYYVDHIDNSEKRDDYLSSCY